MTNPIGAALATAFLALATVSASAAIQERWPVLAKAGSGDCQLRIVGNGKIMEIRASGLVPNERLRFDLTNGDMKPIAWAVRADGIGRWQKTYLPFRFNRAGGIVAVKLKSSECTLAAEAPWSREVRTIG